MRKMNIQSLSIVVPNRRCINNCAFCVSKMHCGEFPNQMDDNGAFYDLYERDYMRRLEFARDNGCNTVMLTGNSEPQQNRQFLQHFANMNERIHNPFKWIELQTTGVLLNDPYLRFLRNTVGVSTISLSLSSFNDDTNRTIIGARPEVYNDIASLCAAIKKYDFNLRLSINLTKEFEENYTPVELFTEAHIKLRADQITFRVLYSNGFSKQAEWVENNAASDAYVAAIESYIKNNGRELEKLPFGRTKWSCEGMSTVIDNDCMSTSATADYKYLILRENCKLYSKWDDPASLIF